MKNKFIKIGLISLLSIFVFSFVGDDFAFAKAPRTIDFAGHEWVVKSGYKGPGKNHWNDSKDAVFVDSKGRLHMKITKVGGQFYSSEVHLENSLGYGTYKFEVSGKSKVDKLDQNLVLGLFLYQDDEHELDIELSNWQYPNGKNLHYSVQPYKTPGNIKSAKIDLDISKKSTYSIKWLPNYVRFRASQKGMDPFVWKYRGKDNFSPGEEVLAMNFWMIDGMPPSNGKEKEIIIRNFEFTPAEGLVVDAELEQTALRIGNLATSSMGEYGKSAEIFCSGPSQNFCAFPAASPLKSREARMSYAFAPYSSPLSLAKRFFQCRIVARN
ncbi:MAG: glycoside hydrolase family 16 protein [Candidatus Gracilibacteria bacterium]|nr:glycoside hydrolase family 16 protein [Candidatus Gracilibacteria bacterium]